MKTILGTGLSGMIGSCITDSLHDRYEMHDVSIDTGIDIRDRDLLHRYVEKVGTDIVLHLAAKTDVDACEKDADSDTKLLEKMGVSKSIRYQPEDIAKIDWRAWKSVNSAYAINVVGTLNIAHVCHELGKKLIYISTDFVFDGQNRDAYTEEDTPNPINHYAKTKYWAEQVVTNTLDDHIIIRMAFPYGTHHEDKKDFVRIIRDRLSSGLEVKAVSDQVLTPTYAPDIVRAIDHLIVHSVASKIFHVVGSQHVSPYNAAIAIADRFGYDTQMIQETTAREYYRNKAVRPQNLSLSNEIIQKRGISMKSFKEGLQEII